MIKREKIKMNKMLALLVFGVLCLNSVVLTKAQYGYTCAFNPPIGYSYMPTHQFLRVNYHATDRTLTLIDSNTPEIYVPLLENVDGYSFNGWSPDCRYVVATVWFDDLSYLIGWEAETGHEVFSIQRVIYNRMMQWSPDERYVIARVYDDERRIANMVIDTGTGQSFVTTWLYRVLWDTQSQHLYAIHLRERDAVHVYQLPSGNYLGMYAPQNTNDRILVQSMHLSSDRTHLVYYTSNVSGINLDGNLERYFEDCSWGFGVYEVTSFTGQIVNTAYRDFQPSSTTGRHRMALSPDKHYIAYGRDIVRIWDLNNIQSDGSANWSFPASEQRIYNLRFIDNQTLETFARYDFRYGVRWDLFTGEYLNTYDNDLNMEVNRDGILIENQ